VPVHYAVIFAGYLTALWLWRRQPAIASGWQVSPRRLAIFVVVATALVLILDGVITQGLILRENPGLTFFVVRALISVPFFLALGAYVGLDGVGIAVGSVLLALVWTTYSMFLGPVGLPWGEIKYPGYETLWLRSFPGQLLTMLFGTWLASRLTGLDRPGLFPAQRATERPNNTRRRAA
jgi:hypothetical protein